MKGSNVSGLKTTDRDKTNGINALKSRNGEIPVPDQNHAHNAQNKELDLIVSNLLEQAVAESSKRHVHMEVSVESENKPSIPLNETVEKKEALKFESGPDYDLEFGVAAGSTEAYHRETRAQQQLDVPGPVQMEGTAQDVPVNSIMPPVIEIEPSRNGPEINDRYNRSLFSAMESNNRLNGKHPIKIPLNKYALAGIMATIVVLICCAAYLIYGRSGPVAIPGVMESVVQGRNTAEPSINPVLPQDTSNTFSATLPTVQNQNKKVPEAPSRSNASDLTVKTGLEQSSGTVDQTAGVKGAQPAETDLKINTKQNNGIETDGSAALSAMKPGRDGQTVAGTMTAGLSSPGDAGEGFTEIIANSPSGKIQNNRNIQREAEQPDIQSSASADRGADGFKTGLDTGKIVASEPTTISVSSVKTGSNVLEIPRGIEPTWKAVEALAPEGVVSNISNNNSEIKSDSFSTNALDVVKEEMASKNINNEYKPPVLVSKVNPSYPRMASQIRETGIVTLKLDVNKQGRVVKAEPIRGPIVFYEEAVRAVLQWRYRPAIRNGENSDSQVTISISFDIK